MRAMRNLHPAWIAAIIGVAVLLWLASGMFAGESDEVGEQQPAQNGGEQTLVKVEAVISNAEPLTREAVVSGRTAPVRSVTVRAETAGRVIEVVAERGALIDKGAVIVRLSVNDRRAQLRQAQAILDQRRLQHKAATRMQAKGYQTAVDLAQAKANLEAAQAEVESVKEDMAHTVIRAPFGGVLETRPVEDGDYLSVGNEVARIIDQDPFIIRGDVSEDVIAFLEPGQPGSAELVDGTIKQGTLRYIASEADEQTRTYRVELEVPNADSRLIAGASSQMRLPLEEVMAHEVEPAILTLNSEGQFGIKSVGEDSRVQFHEADIVRNRDGKVWLAGLPSQLKIITSGQGFVNNGDMVDVVADSADTEAASTPPINAEQQAPEARQ